MKKKEDVYIQQLIAAASTGLVLTLCSPFDLIRNRLQTMGELLRQNRITTPYIGVVDCGKRLIAYEGIFGFWKGNFANLMRFYPNETFNFLTKESIQIWVRNAGLVNKNNFVAVNFISGILGSWIVLMFIYPFDFARTQLSNDLEGQGTIRSFLKKTYQMEGIRGIYRGGMVNFVLSPIFRGIYFGVFDTVKQVSPSTQAKLLGGFIGSFIAIWVCLPADTVRRRLVMTACQNYKYDGFWSCARYIYKREGIKGFTRGGSVIFIQSLGCACILYLYDKIAHDFRTLHSM